MRQVAIYIIILVVTMASCGRRPSYVIPERKMMDVLYDIQLAQAIYRGGGQFYSDEQKDALVAGVLDKHKISQADLDSSLFWYSDNIQYYIVITDSVSARLKVSSERLIAEKNELTSNKRDWSNYIIPPFFYLNEFSPTMSFSIDSSKVKTIDVSKFNLRFNVLGVTKRQNIQATVFFNYKDTLIKEVVAIDKNTHYTFAKPELADSLLKSISGYVHLRHNILNAREPDVILYNIAMFDSIKTDSTQIVEGESQRTSIAKDINSTLRENSQTEKNEMPKSKRRLIKDDDNSTSVSSIDKPTLSVDDNINMRLHKKNRTREVQNKD